MRTNRIYIDRRTVAAALILCLLFAMIPSTALAASFTPTTSSDMAAVTIATPTNLNSSAVTITKNEGTLSSPITITANLTDNDWKALLSDPSADGQGIYLKFTFAPTGCTSIKMIGASTGAVSNDADALNLLTSQSGNAGTNSAFISIPFAQVSYSGTNAVVSPRTFDTSNMFTPLVQWTDGSGAQHYHRIYVTVSHTGGSPVTIAGIAPDSSRVVPDSGYKSTLADGQITYTMPDLSSSPRTGLTPPTGATKATIYLNGNPNDMWVYDIGGGTQGITVTPPPGRAGGYTFIIQWKDRDGNLLTTERLTVNLITGAGTTWMDTHWTPVGSNQYSPSIPALSGHASYDATSGAYTVKINPNEVNSLAVIAGKPLALYITPPSGAVQYKHFHISEPIYENATSGFASDAQTALQNTPLSSIPQQGVSVNLENPIIAVTPQGTQATLFLVKATNINSILTHVVEWYDAQGTKVQVGSADGNFVYLMTEPGTATAQAVLAAPPSSAVTEPTAVHAGAAQGDMLRTEVIPHIDNDNDYDYRCVDLTCTDSRGNKKDISAGIDIYLDYPSGVTYADVQSGKIRLELRHYANRAALEQGGPGDAVTVIPEPAGIKFTATSLSPFILKWTKAESIPPIDDSSSNDIGYSGSAPVILDPAQNWGVIAYVGETATMRITASGASAYQWYVDRGDGLSFVPINGATSASYTTGPVTAQNDGYIYRCIATNFYGSTTSPNITLEVLDFLEIPKTGDSSRMGLWTGLAMIGFAGLAAAWVLRCRNKRENQ